MIDKKRGCGPSLADVTPVVLTYDEEPNVERALQQLGWANRVVVVDSGSRDGTRAICRAAGNVALFERPFDCHACQWTFAVSETGISTKWILALDADYILDGGFAVAMQRAIQDEGIAGYRCQFRYVSLGVPLRGTLYPSPVILYRREAARYVQDGHTQRVTIDGRVGVLDAIIFHDDRKPLSRWLASQARYAALEAEHLLAADKSALSRVDRIRLLAWPAPILVFLYALVVKRCLLDGWPGWFYALQRLLAEVMLALELIDRRFKHAPEAGEPVAPLGARVDQGGEAAAASASDR